MVVVRLVRLRQGSWIRGRSIGLTLGMPFVRPRAVPKSSLRVLAVRVCGIYVDVHSKDAAPLCGCVVRARSLYTRTICPLHYRPIPTCSMTSSRHSRTATTTIPEQPQARIPTGTDPTTHPFPASRSQKPNRTAPRPPAHNHTRLRCALQPSSVAPSAFRKRQRRQKSRESACGPRRLGSRLSRRSRMEVGVGGWIGKEEMLFWVLEVRPGGTGGAEGCRESGRGLDRQTDNFGLSLCVTLVSSRRVFGRVGRLLCCTWCCDVAVACWVCSRCGGSAVSVCCGDLADGSR